MKRSTINRLIREAEIFLAEHRFRLPPFAEWSPSDWEQKKIGCSLLFEQQLGWDITDFGLGDFAKKGLLLFTVRNGVATRQGEQGAKPYAEKVMVVQPGQVTPTHSHWKKMEDIINRGGGELVLRLWNGKGDHEKADTEVRVECDGTIRTLPAGGELVLRPGESVTLPPTLWHEFWGRGGTTLVGEVSRVNDDHTDNNFFEPVGRFPEIEEDEDPYHLLVGDYKKLTTEAGDF